MPRATESRQQKSEQKDKRKTKKYGRPPRPKETSIFEEDSRYTREVIDALTAYLTFTEEIGLPHGFYLNTSNQPEAQLDVEKTVGRIQLPPTIQPRHKHRMNNLIELTRLSMDAEPAREFERAYCSIYQYLKNGDDRKEAAERVLRLVRQDAKQEFPKLNLVGLKTVKNPTGPFERMINAIVACLDQHILSRREEPEPLQINDADDL